LHTPLTGARVYEDDLDDSPPYYIDEEELTEDPRQLPEGEYGPKWKGIAFGFSFTCPRCGGKNTVWTAKEEDWSCFDCGLVFSIQLAWLFDPIRQNDKEQNYVGDTD
jgi:hypothetical protein